MVALCDVLIITAPIFASIFGKLDCRFGRLVITSRQFLFQGWMDDLIIGSEPLKMVRKNAMTEQVDSTPKVASTPKTVRNQKQK